MRPVILLVCGEPMRGDDALAAAVVAALPASTLALAEVRHVGQLMPDDLLGHGKPIILLDAVEGPAPGVVIDLPLASLESGDGPGFSPSSSHALPMPICLAIARHLAGRLPEGRFVGIAAAAYGIGDPLSPAVRDAVPRCAARLNHWIRVLAHGSRVQACA
jgi:hydrogenase maturation protease